MLRRASGRTRYVLGRAQGVASCVLCVWHVDSKLAVAADIDGCGSSARSRPGKLPPSTAEHYITCHTQLSCACSPLQQAYGPRSSIRSYLARVSLRASRLLCIACPGARPSCSESAGSLPNPAPPTPARLAATGCVRPALCWPSPSPSCHPIRSSNTRPNPPTSASVAATSPAALEGVVANACVLSRAEPRAESARSFCRGACFARSWLAATLASLAPPPPPPSPPRQW
jgi:hypothetical protein